MDKFNYLRAHRLNAHTDCAVAIEKVFESFFKHEQLIAQLQQACFNSGAHKCCAVVIGKAFDSFFKHMHMFCACTHMFTLRQAECHMDEFA